MGFGFRPKILNFARISHISVEPVRLFPRQNPLNLGEFFWEKFKTQILATGNSHSVQFSSDFVLGFKFCFSIFVLDLTEKYRNGRISPISLRPIKFPKTKSKSLPFDLNYKHHLIIQASWAVKRGFAAVNLWMQRKTKTTAQSNEPCYLWKSLPLYDKDSVRYISFRTRSRKPDGN
jgi:hypothetical protein